MSIYRNTFRWIGISAIVGLFSLGTMALAQLAPPIKTTEESLSITAGDVFEILAVSDIRVPTYSWILTRNRQFLQAGQRAVFRNRFLEPGTYTLNAQIRGGPNEFLSHTIAITVTPRSSIPPEESPQTIQSDDLVRINPFKNSAGHTILQDTKKTILLTPARPSLALDLLPSIDTNGDAIPQNDQDTSDTFFQEEGSPLFLWFASPLTEKTFLIHDISAPGNAPQMIHVVSLAHATLQNLLTGDIDIDYEMKDDGSFAFLIVFEGNKHPDTPLLSEWDFGDGEKSLVDAPTHTFAKSGTYTVSVHLRNLTTNDTFATAKTPVNVSVKPTIEEPLIPPPPPLETPPKPSTTKNIAAFLPLIGTVGGIILGLIVLTTGIVFILKKIKKGRSTASIVEQVEEKVLKEKEGSAEAPKSFPVDQPEEEDTKENIREEKEEHKEQKKEEAGEDITQTFKDEKVAAFEESATPVWLTKEEKELEVTDSASSRSLTDTAVVPPWLGGTPKPATVAKPTEPGKPPAPPPPPQPPKSTVTLQPAVPTKPLETPKPPAPPSPPAQPPAGPSLAERTKPPAPKPIVPKKPTAGPAVRGPDGPSGPEREPAERTEPLKIAETPKPIQPSTFAKPTEPSPSQKQIESQAPQATVDKPKPTVPAEPAKPTDVPIAFVKVDSIQPIKPPVPPPVVPLDKLGDYRASKPPVPPPVVPLDKLGDYRASKPPVPPGQTFPPPAGEG